MADLSRPCDSDCPPDWKSVEGDCVMFMYGWEEDSARQVCRGLKAEFSEFFISRSDSDSATRHSLPVCLLRRKTQSQGLIISGGSPFDSVGQSVEVYVPSTGQHCELPDLPASRYDHTMEDRTICGGGYSNSDTLTSCLSLTDEGTWNKTATLLEGRYDHSSWASPSGLILLGGGGSIRTSEKIGEDGTSRNSFKLNYTTDDSCAINMESSLIITGGYRPATRRVTEYNEAGWVRDLPSLLTARQQHGCSYFVNSKGTKTYLVVGGYDARQDNLASTELLEEDGETWVSSGELLPARYGLRGVNIDNRVLMTGGYGDYYNDDILEYDVLTKQWKEVANMKNARRGHAVSTINFSEVAQFCN